MRQAYLISERFCAALSRALSLAPRLVTITVATIAYVPLVTLAAPWETTRTIAIQDSTTGTPLGDLKLSVADLNGDTAIKVSGPLPLNAAQLQLEKPPRLVLDLTGLKTGRLGKVSVIGHPTVAGIRISSHEDKLRIVVDLLKEIGFNYSFSKRGNEAGFTLRRSGISPAEAEPAVSVTPEEATPSLDPMPSPSTEELAAYDPTGKRDPFRPFDREDGNHQDMSKPPLERYELSQLKLTGIVGGGDDFTSATLEDSSGRGFIIGKGSRVGAHAGIVTEILRDRITVVETITDASGKQRQRPVVLKLRAQEPEGPEYVEAR